MPRPFKVKIRDSNPPGPPIRRLYATHKHTGPAVRWYLPSWRTTSTCLRCAQKDPRAIDLPRGRHTGMIPAQPDPVRKALYFALWQTALIRPPELDLLPVLWERPEPLAIASRRSCRSSACQSSTAHRAPWEVLPASGCRTGDRGRCGSPVRADSFFMLAGTVTVVRKTCLYS